MRRIPHSSDVCSRTVRRRRWSASRPPSKMPIVMLVLPASSARSMVLHVSRNRDAQYSQRPFQLQCEEFSHPQEKLLALEIRLGKDGVLMTEVVESLRQLEHVFGHVRGLAGSEHTLDGSVGFGGRQQNLP